MVFPIIEFKKYIPENKDFKQTVTEIGLNTFLKGTMGLYIYIVWSERYEQLSKFEYLLEYC